MFPIQTRRQAAEAGQKRYYTGKPCSKGHDAQRFTSTGVCVKCASFYVKEYNGRLRKEANASLRGFFTYPAHPDDMAELLAFAQLLDLRRHRVPHVPPPVPPAPTEQELADVVKAARLRVFGKAGETP